MLNNLDYVQALVDMDTFFGYIDFIQIVEYAAEQTRAGLGSWLELGQPGEGAHLRVE